MELKTTTAEVVSALGGTSAVAALTKRKYSAACNWSTISETFPPNTYVVMKAALKERGFDAPDSLWRMTESAA